MRGGARGPKGPGPGPKKSPLPSVRGLFLGQGLGSDPMRLSPGSWSYRPSTGQGPNTFCKKQMCIPVQYTCIEFEGIFYDKPS